MERMSLEKFWRIKLFLELQSCLNDSIANTSEKVIALLWSHEFDKLLPFKLQISSAIFKINFCHQNMFISKISTSIKIRIMEESSVKT